MKIPEPSPAALERLRTLLAGDSRVQLRKMFGQPAAFVQGNLCVGAFGNELFVRLNEADARILSKVPGVRHFEPAPGRPMKQYFVLPRALLEDRVQAKKWIARSIEFAANLPAK